ncbi:MAG TPA: endonuclease NucS [Syntrophales bacterium]|nr:endonuclease NucS [Syntrophales bacterium]
MNKEPQNEVEEEDPPTVEELETELKKHPKDEDLQEDLAYSLMERYLWGDDDKPAGNDADLKDLRKWVARLPSSRAPWPRAYLAHLDGDKKKFMKYAEAWAEDLDYGEIDPWSSTTTFMLLDMPFENAPPDIYPKWADIFENGWPDSAVAHYLRGMAEWLHEKNLERALDAFSMALEKDSDFWLASMCCGQIYEEQENWRTAYGYYVKALSNESAAEMLSGLHHGAAFCCGKLRDYSNEEKHYSTLLKLTPNDDDARRWLGWALMRQGKHEEALKEFDAIIKRGKAGIYAYRSRAEALKKLGRLVEAIEAWKKSEYRGKLPKYVQNEIARVEDILARQRQGEVVAAEDLHDESEEVEEELEEEEEVEEIVKPRRAPRLTVKTEQMLEEMVEHLINSGKGAFGRTLKMFNSSDGLYGRQYPIPGVGRIDLLTEDAATGDLVVIELKRDETDDQVIGQISRYVSWVREHLAPKGKNVQGVICVKQATRKLMLAVRNINDVKVYEYDLSFRPVAR